MCSSIARYEGDADAMLRSIDAMQAVGSELAIISLPKHEPPDVVERIADTLAR